MSAPSEKVKKGKKEKKEKKEGKKQEKKSEKFLLFLRPIFFTPPDFFLRSRFSAMNFCGENNRVVVVSGPAVK